MFIETAARIKVLLSELDLTGLLVANFGSGTEEFSKVRQPWIWRDVLEPITRQARLMNVDTKQDLWVDSAVLPGDASLDVALCCSMLEHVEDPQDALGQARLSLKIGGLLLLDVPAEYPYHADPIDNGLRLDSEDECAELLGKSWRIDHFEIVRRVGFSHSAALALARRIV